MAACDWLPTRIARKNKKIIWNIYVLLKKRENGVNFGIGKVGSRTKTAAMDSGPFTRAGRDAESHFYQSAAVGTTKRPRDTNPTGFCVRRLFRSMTNIFLNMHRYFF